MEIIQARTADVETISEILREAAVWLIERGEKLWSTDDLTPEKIAGQVARGMYYLALIENEPAGCLRYQLEDKEYWDDVPHTDSAFIHRVAVRRKFAGRGIARNLIEWAKQKARADGKKYLRLDCADRPKLRAVYEGFGFEFHSIKEREPYRVARYQFDLE
jgi:GNAT superfamily N-acetyltransferase